MFRPTRQLRTQMDLIRNQFINSVTGWLLFTYLHSMSFEERSVKVQGQFPERTSHARFVHETDHDGPQNDEFTLSVAIKGNYNFPH